MSSIVRTRLIVHVVDARHRSPCPAGTRMPTLKLSWLIGLIAGSTESKLGTRRSRYPSAPPQRSRPGMLLQAELEDLRRVVERAVVHLPDIAAERQAREPVLGPVVIAAIAAEHLGPPIAQQVVRGADARRDLVGESELNRMRTKSRDGTRGSFPAPAARRDSAVRLPRVHWSCTKRCAIPADALPKVPRSLTS